MIPFQLLKLRDLLAKSRTHETIARLQNLIEYDILNSINVNLSAGNMRQNDARNLFLLTQKLLYAKYTETEEICNMYDQSLELEWNRYMDQWEKMDQTMEQLEEKDK